MGCLLDIDEKTICMECMCATIVNSAHVCVCVSPGAAFTLNGDLLQGSFESTVAFEHINTSEGLVPAITLSAGERAQLNFGQSKVVAASLLWGSMYYHSFYLCVCVQEALHHNYTASGYEPVCR